MTPTSAFRIDTIGYVILFVKDVEKSAAFFRDALGIPSGNMSPEWGELETKGTKLALHRSDDPPPMHVPSIPDIVFNVDDIVAAHATLKDRHVKIHDLKTVWESPEVVGLAAEFHDLDGNRLSIHGTVPRAQWKGSRALQRHCASLRKTRP